MCSTAFQRPSLAPHPATLPNGHIIATPPCHVQVLCGSDDQLREAQHEVAVMRRLHHPCLLPLLEAAVQEQRTPDGGTRRVVLMLFPGLLALGVHRVTP